MKFKDFIDEASQNQHKLSSMLAYLNIPLDTEMMERLGYSYNGEAYHMTSPQWFEELKKMEGTNKQLSTFTIGSSELLKLPSNPQVVIKLSGNVVIEAQSDMWTTIDRYGMRWMDVKDDKIKFVLEGLLISEMKKLGIDISELPIKYNGPEAEYFISNIDKKRRNKLYTNYIKRVEDWIDKGGYKQLNNYLKSYITYSYNEVILNKFKILGAYGLDNDSKKTEIEKAGFKYLGVMTQKEIAKIGK